MYPYVSQNNIVELVNINEVVNRLPTYINLGSRG